MDPINLFKPLVHEEAIEAVQDVLRSGWTGLGPRTAAFESAFANTVNARHCVALNSGTSALHLALRVLDLAPGDEVITTPLTFVSTNHVILYEQAVPVFADVQADTGCLDPRSIATRVSERTKAIVVVHYGGYPADLDEINDLAKQHGIAVIEDCAHAAGASYRGHRIGSISRLNCFSFHSVKNLSLGDGGAVTTSSEGYAERLRRLRWLGIDKSTFNRSATSAISSDPRTYAWQYDVVEVGFKYHMNDITAAIGLAQLAYLEADNRRRAEIADTYRRELAGVPGITLMRQAEDRVSSNHILAVRAQRRDDLMDHLSRAGVNCGVHYLRNDRFRMYQEGDVPNAALLERELISLPLHLLLTDDDVHRVTETIRAGW